MDSIDRAGMRSRNTGTMIWDVSLGVCVCVRVGVLWCVSVYMYVRECVRISVCLRYCERVHYFVRV